jgi:hypothetical protein
VNKTDIANMALSLIGEGSEIANIDTDASAEASAVRRFQDIAIRATLRDFAWPFAKKTVALAVVAQYPTLEWQWAYRYPSDCINFKRILSGVRVQTAQNVVPFTTGADDAGKLIYTDWPNSNPGLSPVLSPVQPQLINPVQAQAMQLVPCMAEYTRDATPDATYDDDFSIALAHRIAWYILPRISIGNAPQLRDSMLRGYMAEVQKAAANAANEAQADQRPDADWIRIRNGFNDDFPHRG